MATGRARDDLLGLKIVVGVLGVLIVVGTTVVVGTVIGRLYAKPEAKPTPAVAAPALPLPVASPAPALGPGEHIAGIVAAGADVVVWIAGPKGERVEAIDPATGAAHLLLSGP